MISTMFKTKNMKLIEAIKKNESIELIDALVKSGADVNGFYKPTNKYVDHYTPLKLALDNGNLDIVKYLVDEAEVNLDWSPPEWIKNNVFERYLYEGEVNEDILSYILNNHIGFQDMLETQIKHGEFPKVNILHYLFDKDKKDTLDLITSYFINNNYSDKIDLSLFLAKLIEFNKFIDFKNIIEENIAIDINKKHFKEEKTFLMIAIENQNYKATSFILSQDNLELKVKDINGLTAYDLALNTGNQPIVQLLEKHGASRDNKLTESNNTDAPSVEWFITADLEISRSETNDITKISVIDSFNFHSKRIISSVTKNGNDNNSSQFIKYFDDLKDLDFIYEAKKIYEEKTGKKISWGDNRKDADKTKFPKGAIQKLPQNSTSN